MFETITATDRAATVTGVETECSGLIFSGFGRVGLSKKRTDGIKGADIASRIGTGGFANRGLIDEIKFVDVFMPR